jgi:hypothetical protein
MNEKSIKPEVGEGFRTNEEFQRWVWGFLTVTVQFHNKHDHDVRVDWLQGGRSGDSWTIAPGAVDRRQVFLSHLFAARDVSTRRAKK